MEKKIKEKVNKTIEESFTLLMDIIIFIVKLILYSILIIGATAAFLLYLNTFPMKGIELYNVFTPIFMILIMLLKAFIIVTMVVVIYWILFNILEKPISNIIESREKKMKQRRDEFINEVSEKINKRLKRK